MRPYNLQQASKLHAHANHSSSSRYTNMESSSVARSPPSTELLCDQQDLHALFHPPTWLDRTIPEEKPAEMLPDSAFGFDCAGFGIAQYGLADVDSRSWIDKNLSYVLLHGLSKESCAEQMTATLTRNGGINEVVYANYSSMDMAQALHKLGSVTHNVGLTVNPSKEALAIDQDMHGPPAPSIDPNFAKSAFDFSKEPRLSFTSSPQQVATNPFGMHEGKLDSAQGRLCKAQIQENLTRMPNRLHTVDKTVSMGANMEKGCQIGLQAMLKQFVTVSPNTRAISQIKEEPMSTDKSDESFRLAAASPCEKNGGFETTTERLRKGKNKRVRDRSKDAATQVPNVKNSETDEVKNGKCCKGGGDTSEEDRMVDSGDSTPLSGKGSSELPEPSKLDYIHVRARRGQATDSHSLAERVRREKISERMKFLQALVPGCSKVTGKALMLDKIINYVQSLQRQVDFLSMKLASVNPVLDFHMDGLFGKEIIQPQATEHKALMMCEESPTSHSPYLHFSQHAHAPHRQMVSPCPLVNVHSLGGLDMAGRQAMHTASASMNYSYGAAVSQPQQLTQITWEEELQQVLQGRPAPLTSSSLPGQPFYNGKMKIGL